MYKAAPSMSARVPVCWALGRSPATTGRDEVQESQPAMRTQWARLAGDTGVFALKIAFASDPDEGQGIDAETAASWGSFQVWVQGRNLCAHREAGEHINSVHWYLLPLLEWFARNWDPLLHEERLPAKNMGNTAWESLRAIRFPPPAIEDDERKASVWETQWQGWRNRHALCSAREGGLFPDIVIRRLRDQIELSWGSVRVAGEGEHHRFTESDQGFATLPPQTVAEPLHEILSQAARHLSSQIPGSKRIMALNRRLQGLTGAHDAHERRSAWLAGLGTTARGVQTGWRRATENLSSLAARPRRAMLEAKGTPLVIFGSCQAALMFGSLEPTVKSRDVTRLAQVMVDLFDPQGMPWEVSAVGRAVPIGESGLPAWDQGYELAEEVHEFFKGKFEQGSFVDVDELIEALGIKVARLDLSDEKVRGCAIAGPKHRPGIFFNGCHASNAYAAGVRFTLAHELCHLLFDRELGCSLAVASGPWASCAVEQRADAFAAMMLMPVSLVKRVVAELAGSIATDKSIDEVASRLHAGRRAVLNHLTNLGFIDESDRQCLEAELSPVA